MKKQFEDAKIGDRVWSILKGWGKIIKITTSSTAIIVVQSDVDNTSDMYFTNGTRNYNEINPTLFWDEIKFDIPNKPKQLVTKTIIGYTNLYNTTQDTYQTLENNIKSGGVIYNSFEECTKFITNNNTIFRGAKVTIEYQIEE